MSENNIREYIVYNSEPVSILQIGVHYGIIVISRMDNAPEYCVVNLGAVPERDMHALPRCFPGHSFSTRDDALAKYAELDVCNCAICSKDKCVHRNAFRRLPQKDGGLGLCFQLK